MIQISNFTREITLYLSYRSPCHKYNAYNINNQPCNKIILTIYKSKHKTNQYIIFEKKKIFLIRDLRNANIAMDETVTLR